MNKRDTPYLTGVVPRLRAGSLGIAVLLLILVAVGLAGLLRTQSNNTHLVTRSLPALIQTESLGRTLRDFLIFTDNLGALTTLQGIAAARKSLDEWGSELGAVSADPAWSEITPMHSGAMAASVERLLAASQEMISYREQIITADHDLNALILRLDDLRSDIALVAEIMSVEAHSDMDREIAGLEPAQDLLFTVRKWNNVFASIAEIMKGVDSVIAVSDQNVHGHFNDLDTLGTRETHETSAILQRITHRLPELPDNPSRLKLSASIASLHGNLIGERGVVAIAATRADAQNLFDVEHKLQQSLSAGIWDMSELMIESQKSSINETFIASQKDMRETIIQMGIACVCILLLMVGIHVGVVERQINTRMRRLILSVRAIASGDIEYKVDLKGRDEIGEMGASLNVFKSIARDLKRSNEDLQKFAYVASHDMKSPLQSIRDLAQWTLEDAEGVLPDTARKNLNFLVDRVDRLSRILSDLLDYALIGESRQSPETINIDDMITDIYTVAGEERFRLNIYSNIEVLVAYPAPLRQVLLNLIVNAIKHHDRDEGEITITVDDAGSAYEFSVTDDGPGIDPDYQSRIFEMFQTFKSSEEIEGSGMGLALIRKIVDRNGGHIKVSSTPTVTRGTTFTFDWLKIPQKSDVGLAA